MRSQRDVLPVLVGTLHTAVAVDHVDEVPVHVKNLEVWTLVGSRAQLRCGLVPRISKSSPLL
jgi:hypothetical protein